MLSKIQISDWPIVRGRSADLFCIWKFYAYVRKGSSRKRLLVSTKVNCLWSLWRREDFVADFCDSDLGPIPLTFSPKDISTKCFTLKLSSYAALGKSKHWLEAQRQALPVRLNPVQICDHRCKLAGQDDSSLWSGSTHPHEQHSLYLFPCASKIVWHLHWFWARSSLQLPPCKSAV